MTFNDTTFDYLYEFYGDSAKWFGVYVLVTSLFVIISDSFFIIFTLTNHSLRSNRANWFLLGFSVADTLHCAAHAVGAYGILNGSVDNRHWCRVAGIFVILTSTCSFGFPALIAADRYYKICTISQSTGIFSFILFLPCNVVVLGFSISSTIFGPSRTLPLIVGWFFLSAILNLPLVMNDAHGEDPSGFCGAKKFTSLSLMMSYAFSGTSAFVGSLILTAIYYFRLIRWLKRHKTSRRNSLESVVYTRGIMRVVKATTLLPLFTDTAVAVLSSGQMFLPVLPMWINRLLVAPYYLSSAANPWLTIGLVRPFRDRFRQLMLNVKGTVPSNVNTG